MARGSFGERAILDSVKYGRYAQLNGFYAKGNEITKGKWFTWSWGGGKNPGEIDEDFGGLYADYNFDKPHPWMAGDSFGVTWGYLVNGTKVEILKDKINYKPNLMRPEIIVPSLEFNENIGETYAQQVSGFLLPSETGDYTFWIAADDEGELWLGEAGSEKVDKKLCWTTEWVNPREFDRKPSQKSASVHLEKGKAYPIMVLHAQGRGNVNLSVAWTRSGDDKREIIGGKNISVTPDGKKPGVRERIWSGSSTVADLTKRFDYPEGRLPIEEGVLPLNGKDQFVELPKDVADFSACTYSAEFRWDGREGEKLFEFANPNGDALWLSPSENGKLIFGIRKGKTVEFISVPAAKKDVWTKVQIMLDGKKGTLYVDDKKVAENPDMTLKPESVRATECYLGRGLKGGYFSGSINHFTVHCIPLIHSNPPSPNPAAFELVPAFINPGALVMAVLPGYVPAGTVEYFFEEDGGSWNSGWTKESRILIDNKDSKKPASYHVKMRDKLGNGTAFSAPVQAAGIGHDAKAYAVTPTEPAAIEADGCVPSRRICGKGMPSISAST